MQCEIVIHVFRVQVIFMFRRLERAHAYFNLYSVGLICFEMRSIWYYVFRAERIISQRNSADFWGCDQWHRLQRHSKAICGLSRRSVHASAYIEPEDIWELQ